jgi:hypothetical protein
LLALEGEKDFENIQKKYEDTADQERVWFLFMIKTTRGIKMKKRKNRGAEPKSPSNLSFGD